jgi:DNA-binding response OmpR family regulator
MKRILVVEDEHAIREMIGFELKKAGLQFEEAADAEQALVAIASNPPDTPHYSADCPGRGK